MIAQCIGWLAGLPAPAEILLKMTLILVAGWAIHFTLSHRNPRWRMALWRGMAVALILTPLAVLVAPAFEIPVGQTAPAAPRTAFSVSDGAPVSSGPAAERPSVATARVSHEIAPSSSVTHGSNLVAWLKSNILYALGILWATGVAVLALRLATVSVRLNNAVRGASPAPARALQAVRTAAVALGCKRDVSLRVSSNITSPFLGGIRQPYIVLPRHLTTQPYEEELAAVLAHELAHLCLRDLWWTRAILLVQATLWFHPLVWRVRTVHASACEETCDAIAANYVGDALSYSGTLASVALAMAGQPIAAVGIPMARHSDVRRRLEILKRGIYSSPLAKRWLTVSLLAGFAFVTCLAGIRFVSAETAKLRRQQAVTVQKLPAKSLHQAAADGDLEAVEALIAKGGDINQKDDRGKLVLITAARCGHTDIMALLIAKGALINAKETDGTTPLIAAVSSGREDVVRQLLSNGADANVNSGAPLRTAVWKGHLEIAQQLVSKGVDLDAKKAANGATPLHTAVYYGRKEAAEMLIASGADVNAKDKEGYLPVDWAVWQADREMLELMIDRGADLQTKDAEGWTLLHQAVSYSDVERSVKSGIVTLLLDKGLDINAQTEAGETPLDVAIQNPNLSELAARATGKAAAKLLVAKGAQISSLHAAAYLGDLIKMKSLLQEGVPVNATNSIGETALHAAAGGGEKEVAAFLIEKGGDVTAMDERGRTPLHRAPYGDDKELVGLFIASGGAVNAKDTKTRNTPLHEAAWSGHADIARLLIAKGADLDARGGDSFVVEVGATPLHLATTSEFAEVLLAAGADVDAKARGQTTPLGFAASRGHVEVVRLLISKGAGVNSRTDTGSTALHGAAIGGHSEVAQLLLGKGADVNAKNNDGSTPLHAAAWKGRKDVVQLLMANGADTNIRNVDGFSPLHSAENANHMATAKLLRQQAATHSDL